MAAPGVIGSVGRDGANGFLGRGVRQELRQHRPIADLVAGDLNGSDLQRLRIDAEVDLALLPKARGSVFAGGALAFTSGLNAGAVDQEGAERPC